MHSIDHLRADDPVIASLVEREHARQAASLNLIAAESTAPESVHATTYACGHLTDVGPPRVALARAS